MDAICSFILMAYFFHMFTWGALLDLKNNRGYPWGVWLCGLLLHIAAFILLIFYPGNNAMMLTAASSGLASVEIMKACSFILSDEEGEKVSFSTMVFTFFLNVILLLLVANYTYVIWFFGTAGYIVSLVLALIYERNHPLAPIAAETKEIVKTAQITKNKTSKKFDIRKWKFWPFKSPQTGFEIVTEASTNEMRVLDNSPLSRYEAEMLNILGIPDAELDPNALERAYQWAKNTYDPTQKGGKEMLKIIEIAYAYLKKARN